VNKERLETVRRFNANRTAALEEDARKEREIYASLLEGMNEREQFEFLNGRGHLELERSVCFNCAQLLLQTILRETFDAAESLEIDLNENDTEGPHEDVKESLLFIADSALDMAKGLGIELFDRWSDAE
jgi:hypothetical protein